MIAASLIASRPLGRPSKLRLKRIAPTLSWAATSANPVAQCTVPKSALRSIGEGQDVRHRSPVLSKAINRAFAADAGS